MRESALPAKSLAENRISVVRAAKREAERIQILERRLRGEMSAFLGISVALHSGGEGGVGGLVLDSRTSKMEI